MPKWDFDRRRSFTCDECGNVDDLVRVIVLRHLND